MAKNDNNRSAQPAKSSPKPKAALPIPHPELDSLLQWSKKNAVKDEDIAPRGTVLMTIFNATVPLSVIQNWLCNAAPALVSTSIRPHVIILSLDSTSHAACKAAMRKPVYNEKESGFEVCFLASPALRMSSAPEGAGENNYLLLTKIRSALDVAKRGYNVLFVEPNVMMVEDIFTRMEMETLGGRFEWDSDLLFFSETQQESLLWSAFYITPTKLSFDLLMSVWEEGEEKGLRAVVKEGEERGVARVAYLDGWVMEADRSGRGSYGKAAFVHFGGLGLGKQEAEIVRERMWLVNREEDRRGDPHCLSVTEADAQRQKERELLAAAAVNAPQQEQQQPQQHLNNRHRFSRNRGRKEYTPKDEVDGSEDSQAQQETTTGTTSTTLSKDLLASLTRGSGRLASVGKGVGPLAGSESKVGQERAPRHEPAKKVDKQSAALARAKERVSRHIPFNAHVREEKARRREEKMRLEQSATRQGRAG